MPARRVFVHVQQPVFAQLHSERGRNLPLMALAFGQRSWIPHSKACLSAKLIGRVARNTRGIPPGLRRKVSAYRGAAAGLAIDRAAIDFWD